MAAKAQLEKKVAKSLACAHCGRMISPKEVKDRKCSFHEGKAFCAGCSKDPARILLGHSSDEQAVGKCRTCGEPIAPGQRGECIVCAAKVEKLREESFARSDELATSNLSYPCDGASCSNSVGRLAGGWAALRATAPSRLKSAGLSQRPAHSAR